MKNTLGDLNNYLFEQLERLNDDDLSQEQLDREIHRSHAVSNIAKNIINNGNLVLKARERMVDSMDAEEEIPRMLMSE